MPSQKPFNKVVHLLMGCIAVFILSCSSKEAEIARLKKEILELKLTISNLKYIQQDNAQTEEANTNETQEETANTNKLTEDRINQAMAIFQWEKAQNSCKAYASVKDETVYANFAIYNYEKEQFQTSRDWSYEEIKALLEHNNTDINQVGLILEKVYIGKVQSILEDYGN